MNRQLKSQRILSTLYRFIAWSCLGLTVFAAYVGPLAAQDEDKDLRGELPRIPATEPLDAIKTFKLIDGLRIELVAAEPLVTSPVDMSFDEDGRIWVVEMNDYPYGPAEGIPPQGCVKVLEDTDEDGRMDRGTVLVNQLAWPTGLALWDGGCFVSAAPDIWYFKDSDGDGSADVREIVFTGFGKQNVQALLNNIKWGIDNWFYGAGGPNGGTIRSSRRAVLPEFNVGARDFRFRPNGDIEPVSGGGQFGHSIDDFGRRFVCSNSNQARHVVLEDRYLARNPSLPVASVIHSIASDGDQGPVYRRSPPEPWRIVRTRLRVAGSVPGPIEFGGKVTGYFTSATGITVFRGTALGDNFYGNLFIGDVASNLVHRKVVRPYGVTFVANRVEQEHEFLASTDTWFRPCNFANGPDGALYICDIYREVVEHPASIPEIIKKHLDLTSGKDRGRIWRVVRDRAARSERPQLGTAHTSELVRALTRRDGWWREVAGRLLFERQDKRAVPDLNELVRHDRPETRVAALWALDGLGALQDGVVVSALGDDCPDVREQAIRLAEPRANRSQAIRDRLFHLVSDESMRVRFQLASSIGSVHDQRVAATLGKLAMHDGQDVWCRTAILSSLGDSAVADTGARSKASVLLDTLTKNSDQVPEVSAEFLAQLVVLIGTRNRPEEVNSALRFITGGPGRGREDACWSMLRGLAEGRRRAGVKAAPLAIEDFDGGVTGTAVRRMLDRALVAVQDETGEESRRIAAMNLIAYDTFDRVHSALAAALNPRQPQPLQLAVVRTLSAYGDPRVAALLLSPWRTYSPPVRREALEALLSRPDRVPALLDALESGTVRRGDIEIDRRAQLIQYRDPAIRDRAKGLLGPATSEDRGKVIAQYRRALNDSPSTDRGKALFIKHCATCHRFQGEGTEVGPDLRTVQERTSDQLLEQILDPNREINPAYINYTVALTDGRVLTGMIASESATSVTLKRAEGASDTVLRSQIDEMISTGISIMPEGLEKDITPEELADVIAYVRGRQP
jgi:putative membrane-bound dehydrogenase-like protein